MWDFMCPWSSLHSQGIFLGFHNSWSNRASQINSINLTPLVVRELQKRENLPLDSHWKNIQATRPGKHSRIGQWNLVSCWERPSEQERIEKGIICQMRFQSDHHHQVAPWSDRTHWGQMDLNFFSVKWKKWAKWSPWTFATPLLRMYWWQTVLFFKFSEYFWILPRQTLRSTSQILEIQVHLFTLL